jgi:YD repeat-containing protein
LHKRWFLLTLAVSAVLSMVAPLTASETTTYSYDALGRLVTVSVSGGPVGGTQASTAFDPAGNRTTYAVTGVPPSATFSVNSVSATEGSALVFTITKTGTPSGTLTVNYATSNGTATSASDYTAASGTLTFLAGEASKTVSVPTTNDILVEGNETLTLTLSGASPGAAISTAAGTGTIVDNDASFAIANATAVTEGGAMTFTVRKTGAFAASVNYASASGTATSGTDFTAKSGTLSFLAGDTTKTITVATTDDALAEGTETLLMNLSSPTGGAMITTSQGSGTINDNDVPSFAIGNATAVNEGTAMTFTVTKTAGGSGGTYSVNYASASGTATSGTDFILTSGTLTFLTTDTTKTITVATATDALYESAETILMNLSSPTGGAAITTSQGTGTLNNTNAAPSFSIGNAVATTEGGGMTFTVTKTGGTALSHSVNYLSASGTAISGTDFVLTSGTLTFLPTETTKTIVLATMSDSIFDPGETVLMNISAPTSGATIATSGASGTINDNNAAPSFSISNAAAVAEGGTLAFTVTKSGATALSHSVNYASAGGTATSGTDFTPVAGTFTFLAGETSKIIYVGTIDDGSVEPDETVLLNLSSATGGATISVAQGSGTIANNDVANLPPIANTDSTFFQCNQFKTVDVVANDTDPENNTPLTVLSIVDPGGSGYAVVSSSTSVTVSAVDPATYYFNYVVSDSLGATSTGQLIATVTGKPGICQ